MHRLFRDARKLSKVAGIYLFGFLFAGTMAQAQPVPKINSISPRWIQRGVTNIVLIEGENLMPISRLIFPSEKEVSAGIYAPQPGTQLESSQPGVFASAPPSDKQVKLSVVVSAEAVPGAREMRVVTPTGVSNPIKFNVSDIPEVMEAGNDNSLENAQMVTLPAGVSGRIGAGDEIDYFRFQGKKSQRLIFDVEASRDGSPLDSSLAVLDAKGKELTRNEDANGLDSLIDFTVPADGDYILQLRDFRYRGGAEYTYHVRCGALPYVDSIFPFGGERGKPVDVKLHGRNLDEASIHLQLADMAPLGAIDVRGHNSAGYSNARRFVVGRQAETTEQEPNNSAAEANNVTLPAAINGRIEKEKDVDYFKFKAEKGQRFIFEVLAPGYGSPLDAVLAVRETNNNILQENNGSGGANSRIDYTFDKAGEFLVSVRDLLDRGGKDFVYRLTIQHPARPTFNARLVTDTVRVSRGSRTCVRVEAGRFDFGGAVEISGQELPRGVRCEPLLIPSGLPGGWLEISAAKDAEVGSYRIKLAASAEMDGKTVTRGVSASGGGEGETAGPFLTVLDQTPFTVKWVTLAADLRQEDSTSLRGEITRAEGFKGDVKVSVQGFTASADEDINRNLEIGATDVHGDTSDFSMSAKAKMNSELGTRPIMLRAEAQINGAAVVQYSDPIPLSITQYPFLLSSSLPRLSLTVLKPGQKSEAGEAEFSVRVERRGWFTDAIGIALEGLPEGIVATATNLPPNVGDALIRLTTNDKAKPGTNTFTIVGTANVNGNSFRQNGPAIVLTVNPSSESAETAKE